MKKNQFYKLNLETCPPHISHSLPHVLTIIDEVRDEEFSIRTSSGHDGTMSRALLEEYYILVEPEKDKQPKPVADKEQPQACEYNLITHLLSLIEQWESEDEPDFGKEVSIKPGQLYIQKEEEVCTETACAKTFVVEDVFKRPNGELLFTKANSSDLVLHKAQYLDSYELLEPVF